VLLPRRILSDRSAVVDGRRTSVGSSVRTERCLDAAVVDVGLNGLGDGVEGVVGIGIFDVGDTAKDIDLLSVVIGLGLPARELVGDLPIAAWTGGL